MCVRPSLEKITNWLKMVLDIFFNLGSVANSLVAVAKSTQNKKAFLCQTEQFHPSDFPFSQNVYMKEIMHNIMVNNKNTQSFLKSKQCQGQDTGIKQKGGNLLFWVRHGEYYTSVVPSFKT